MRVKLLAHTPEPEKLICLAAHVCYSEKEIEEIKTEDAARMIGKVIGAGHQSVLEHATFTFGLEGISRACLSQLTRHRLASYSVRSQRYCKVSKEEYVQVTTPKENLSELMTEAYESAWKVYAQLIKEGMPKEDARMILPLGTKTTLVMTMNARELLRFFELRCCQKAQREIRELAEKMLGLVKAVAPNVFKRAGAYCKQNGYCREAIPCGREDVPHKHFLMALKENWQREEDEGRAV